VAKGDTSACTRASPGAEEGGATPTIGTAEGVPLAIETAGGPPTIGTPGVGGTLPIELAQGGRASVPIEAAEGPPTRGVTARVGVAPSVEVALENGRPAVTIGIFARVRATRTMGTDVCFGAPVPPISLAPGMDRIGTIGEMAIGLLLVGRSGRP